jgi:hypothetical protein
MVGGKVRDPEPACSDPESERATFTYGAFRRFDVATEERVKIGGFPR